MQFRSRTYGLLVLCLGYFISNAQDTGLEQLFMSPVDHTILLSGNFGEIRSTHFHTGLDIKSSRGVAGDAIQSIGDGHISRIKVESTGFGNALYITHPNGYTSVYAHLKEFSGEIAAYVKSQQYKRQSFELNLFPSSKLFPVKQGQKIGKMGNSGRSFGPHLHFEIRETETEFPVNPMKFNISPGDDRPPVVESLKGYFYGESGALLSDKEWKLIKATSKNNWTLAGGALVSPTKKFGFGVKLYDQMNGAYNRNGIYSMEVKADGQKLYGFKSDKISFDELNFVHAHIDYAEKKTSNRSFTNCFTYPSNKLSIYDRDISTEPYIILDANNPKKITVIVSDFHGNQSIISFDVEYEPAEINLKSSPYNYSLKQNKDNEISLGELKIDFPKGSLVKDENILVENPGNGEWHIANETIPLLKSVKITRDISQYSLNEKEKLCLVKPANNKMINYGGIINKSVLISYVNELGKFQWIIDSIPPEITPVRFRQNMKSSKSIVFKITDNLEPASRKYRMKYRGKIDGEWVLFEYDQKNDLLTYRFDEHCPSGEHNLHVEVMDYMGNVAVFNGSFRN